MRGATNTPTQQKQVRQISIHAPHAGCDVSARLFSCRNSIFQSTHPMRGATWASLARPPRAPISIHAPHAGCDRHTGQIVSVCFQFQSTHPMRGATLSCFAAEFAKDDFNPRTPCGVRRFKSVKLIFRAPISIHAPHAGCDSMVKIFRFYRRFQRHFREAENLPCTYRGFSQFFLLLASPSRYRIIVSLGS